MVITEAGEVGLSCGPLPQIVLRPTLHAMSRIGEPKEIVEIAARIFGGNANVMDVLQVIWACCDDDVSDYTGYVSFDEESEKPVYVGGAMPLDDVVVIAAHLLEHGVIGKTKPKSKNTGNYRANSEFVASEYAALAIAHLGMSEREAWATSMTTLVNALHSKFPDIGKPSGPGANAPSLDELDADMEWLDKVNKLRGG